VPSNIAHIAYIHTHTHGVADNTSRVASDGRS